MARITVMCENFSGMYQSINGIHNLTVSLPAFFRAVVTVGFQRYRDLFRPGWRNFFYRFGMGLSVLSLLEQRNNALRISNAYRQLNGSEKVAVTYWYGMVFTKLIAEKVLNIPWLIHVDQLLESDILTISPTSNKRGDLVGKGLNGDWHVFEAKARSNPYPPSLVKEAKRQAAMVKSINGCRPSTASACITSLFTQSISVLLTDPPYNTNGEEWHIKDDEYFKQYYYGVKKYIQEYGRQDKQIIGKRTFFTAPLFPFFEKISPFSPQIHFPKWQFKLGLLSTIYKDPIHAEDAVKNMQYDDEGKIGRDGIAIFGDIPNWEVISAK